MNAPRWHLLAALAALCAAPALAQQSSIASIPDFAGIWAHPYLTGFEPPVSGPGPVLNRARLPNGISNFGKLVVRVDRDAKLA